MSEFLTPAQMDREERKRVEALRRSATVTRMHQSSGQLSNIDSGSKISRKRSRIANTGVPVGRLQLGFTDSISLGDAVRSQLVKRAEFEAQQGACKTLMMEGQPVPQEWQLLSHGEIRKRMGLPARWFQHPQSHRSAINERRDSLPGESR